jgi:predicted transcriptional regulator
MEKRTLTVTIKPDWRAALRAAARNAFAADAYQGETLNFETPAASFSRLTEKRWAMLYALQGAGEVPVRELSRRLKRDVKRVHEDVELGHLEAWQEPTRGRVKTLHLVNPKALPPANTKH